MLSAYFLCGSFADNEKFSGGRRKIFPPVLYSEPRTGTNPSTVSILTAVQPAGMRRKPYGSTKYSPSDDQDRRSRGGHRNRWNGSFSAYPGSIRTRTCVRRGSGGRSRGCSGEYFHRSNRAGPPFGADAAGSGRFALPGVF